jgi:signal transduction histidine kinase
MRAYGARPLLLGGALVGIVIVSALAVRESMSNARERRAAAEHTVRQYAMFASYLYASRAYLLARDRALFEGFRIIHPSDPWLRRDLPPVAAAFSAVPDTTERCGPPDKWPIYKFRVDMPSRVVTFAGGPPDPGIQKIIRDSVPVLAASRWGESARFGYVFVDGPEGRETVAWAPIFDSASKPNLIAVYGYRSCYGVRDKYDYQLLYRIGRVLPPMTPGYVEEMTRKAGGDSVARSGDPASDPKMLASKWPWGMPADSLLSLTISDAQGRKLFESRKHGPSSNYYGVSEQRYIGEVTFWVSLRSDGARLLVPGGIPPSRVPASLLLLAGSIVLAIAGFASLRSEVRLVRSRERFLANVSHELRTPLQQILMFVQLLRLGKTRSEAERERSLEIVERETHRLIALSNAVLAATKPELKLQSGPVDVAHVVQTAADFFGPLADARKMRIDLDQVEPATARGDQGAIRQILINVLDNAAKYGPPGQTISMGVRDDGKKVRIWVDDSGPGIPVSQRENVWEAFVRGNDSLEDSTGGAGLGLAIVRDLATAMGGEADLATIPDGGTRFTLTLHRSTNGTHP